MVKRSSTPTTVIDTKTALASEGVRDMTEAQRERKWPNLRPRSAATLIIIDRSKPKAEILMGKRHAGHVFMPGKYVFPGGRIEPADRSMAIAAPLHAKVEEKLAQCAKRGPSIGHARALALAAIRETFEETGLLIGTKEHGAAPNPPEGVWSDFAAHGVIPSLEGLHFIARAITPPRRPRRFDAAFFAIDATEIAHRVEGIVGPDAELTELDWLPLDRAAELDLPTITSVVLKELAARVAAGMGHDLAVPFYNERHRKWYRDEM